jgi:dolichol kinase
MTMMDITSTVAYKVSIILILCHSAAALLVEPHCSFHFMHSFTFYSHKMNMDPLIFRAASFFLLVVLFQVLVARVALQAETKRRLQHALTGHALVQISYFLPLAACIILLLLGAFGMYAAQAYAPIWFQQTFGALLRKDELSGKQLPGAFYFLLGTALTAWIASDLNIARYAVECLAIADPMASFWGSTIPSPKVCPGSSMSGCIACFGTAWMVGVVMLPLVSQSTLLLGALACTIAEASPYGNDNMNIPLLTAIVVDRFGGGSGSGAAIAAALSS